MFYGIMCMATTASVLLIGWCAVVTTIADGDPSGWIALLAVSIMSVAAALYWGNEINRGLK